MNLRNKYILFCAVIFIITPIILSTLSSDNITATDWVYRHSIWIKQYIRGDFSRIYQYPPLFHFLMLPFVAVDFPMKYFQIIFSILATGSILLYTYKKENENTLIYIAILLASSIAFVEFAGSLMPQALDYVLFSFILLFYFKNKVKSTIFCILTIFFMHLTGMVFLLILFTHSLFTKRYKFAVIFLTMIILLTPIFIYYHNLPVQYKWWDPNAQELWEMQYLKPFYNFFFYSGFLTWILLPYAIYKLYKKRFKLSETQLLYIIWIGVFMSFLFFQQGIWRTISYQILPLSLLVASLVSE